MQVPEGKSRWDVRQVLDQFRRDAVALHRAPRGGRTFAAVAKEIGVNHETLRNWVRATDAEMAMPEPAPNVASGPSSHGLARPSASARSRRRSCAGQSRRASRPVAGSEPDGSWCAGPRSGVS
ncbi:transposase [Kitasatospora sp. NPDC001574]